MQFARATRNRYPDVALECWRPECSLRVPYAWHDKEYNITHRVFPSIFLRYGWELSLTMLRAAKDLVQSGEWCFLVHGSYNLHAYILAYLLKGTPTILQSHGGLPALARMRLSQRRWLKVIYLLLASFEGHALSQYPHIFAINLQEKYSIEETLSKAAVSFSPAGVDFDLFSPGDKRTSRENLGLAIEAQIVIYVGRLSPEKGLRFLIDASAVLLPRFPQFQLYLVGSGPIESALKQQANALGIWEHVHFVGYMDHMALVDWYRAADVACLPSLFEGFGMSAAEAMACGTLAVVARSAGTEAVVNTFECGITVPARDATALSSAIEQVLSGSNNTRPNIARARSLLDWSTKLQHIAHLFQAMEPTKSGCVQRV